MIIIDDMSNIRDMVFMSGIHKHEEWWSLIMCRTLRTRYVWLEEININEYFIDNASENNKRISLFHAHFFLPCSILPSSCFFVILFHCCSSHAQVLGTTFVHEFHILIAIQNVTCFYRETRWSLFIGRRFACQKQTIIIIKFLPLRYIFFTGHPIIIRPPYNQYLNYICIWLG